MGKVFAITKWDHAKLEDYNFIKHFNRLDNAIKFYKELDFDAGGGHAEVSVRCPYCDKYNKVDVWDEVKKYSVFTCYGFKLNGCYKYFTIGDSLIKHGKEYTYRNVLEEIRNDSCRSWEKDWIVIHYASEIIADVGYDFDSVKAAEAFDYLKPIVLDEDSLFRKDHKDYILQMVEMRKNKYCMDEILGLSVEWVPYLQ